MFQCRQELSIGMVRSTNRQTALIHSLSLAIPKPLSYEWRRRLQEGRNFERRTRLVASRKQRFLGWSRLLLYWVQLTARSVCQHWYELTRSQTPWRCSKRTMVPTSSYGASRLTSRGNDCRSINSNSKLWWRNKLGCCCVGRWFIRLTITCVRNNK